MVNSREKLISAAKTGSETNADIFFQWQFNQQKDVKLANKST